MSQVPQPGLFDVETPEALTRARRTLDHPGLAPVEMAVLRALLQPSPRLGKREALGIAAMQRQWKEAGRTVYSERAVKGAVKVLIEEHEVPIGSCRVPGENGYYLLSCLEEAEDTSRPLRNEIYSLFARLKATNPKSHFVRSLAGQIELLKKEEAA